MLGDLTETGMDMTVNNLLGNSRGNIEAIGKGLGSGELDLIQGSINVVESIDVLSMPFKAVTGLGKNLILDKLVDKSFELIVARANISKSSTSSQSSPVYSPYGSRDIYW